MALKKVLIVFVLIASAYTKSVGKEDKTSQGEHYRWVKRNANVLPYLCDFTYGGGSNRLLYVGRVVINRIARLGAIHHYGPAGTSTMHSIQGNKIEIHTEVEWLCSNETVGWLRVGDFSESTLQKHKTVNIGQDESGQPIIGCICHSFYSDTYPPSVGVVQNGACIFEVNGKIVSSADFSWWYTSEILVEL